MTKPFLSLLFALTLTIARPETLTTSFLLQGAAVGQNVYTEQSDGAFVSKSSFTVPGMSFESTITGRWKDGIVVAFVSKTTQGSETVEATYADKKFSMVRGGKAVLTDQAFDMASHPTFAAFHPQFMRAGFGAEPKVKVFALDNLAVLEATVESEATRRVELGAETVIATVQKINLSGVSGEVVFGGGKVYGLRVASQGLEFTLEGAKGVFADPLAAYPELSQPRYKVKRYLGLTMPMRDGVDLVADMAMPDQPGKWPTVLVRTCYGRSLSMAQAEFWAARGYAFVSQDVRGRGQSGGTWDPFNSERKDGYDTIDWLAKQSWSSARVGMIGASYLGSVQWAAAVTKHPALKCIIPQVSPPDPLHNVPWDHGAFLLLGNVWWSRIVAQKDADMSQVFAEIKNFKAVNSLPLTRVDDELLGRNISFFDTWLKRTRIEDWPGGFRLSEVSNVKIPVLHVSGTWDGDGIGTKLHWEALRAAGHKNQWLVFGPWEHGFNAKTQFGDTDYGPDSVIEIDSLYLRFFDTYLKVRDGMMAGVPRAKVFLAGANRWLTSSDWPPPGSKSRVYYLAGKPSTGSQGKGELSTVRANAQPFSFVYDPKSEGVKTDSLNIQAETSTKLPKESMEDAIVFSGPVLGAPIRVGGPVKVELFVSTTAHDATFHAVIADRSPGGELRIVGLPGTMRVGWTQTGLIDRPMPGEKRKVVIEPWNFAHEFKPGHRIVLMVTSNLFPGMSRNPGTGEPDATAKKLVKATHTIYRSGERASRVTFTILP